MKVKNIIWYTRDGDLDFLGRLSLKLMEINKNIESCYVCHTDNEKVRLKKKFNVESTALQNYLIEKKDKNSSFNIDRLKKLQKKYDFIPLRKLVWCEMFEKQYPDSKLAFHIITYFDFWEKYLTNNRIDCVVSEFPAILSTNVLWTICKKTNIKFLAFTLTGIDERSYVTADWNGHINGLNELISTIKINYQSDNYKNALNYYEKMINKPEKPKYYNTDLLTGEIIQAEKGKLYVKIPKLPKNISIEKILAKIQHRNDQRWYLHTSRYEKYKIFLVSKIRMYVHNIFNIFESNLTDINENYFLFGLSMLHEWSLYCWSGIRYAYPLDTLREISACLPIGYKLYVKEHTAYFPQRSFSFYNEIKKIPNVRLVDRRENTFELIKNACGVVTVGGTMGWEAFLLGTPVITLTDVWYSAFPGVYMAKNTADLLSVMQIIDDNPPVSDNDKIKVIYCLYKLSVDASLYPYPVLLSNPNIDKFAKFVIKWLETNIFSKVSNDR